MFNIFKMLKKTDHQKRIDYYLKSAQIKFRHTTEAKVVFSGRKKERVPHDLILINATGTFILPDGRRSTFSTQIESIDVTTKGPVERSTMRKRWKKKSVDKAAQKELCTQFKYNLEGNSLSKTELENLFNDISSDFAGDK